jgi:hypothetical protein
VVLAASLILLFLLQLLQNRFLNKL